MKTILVIASDEESVEGLTAEGVNLLATNNHGEAFGALLDANQPLDAIVVCASVPKATRSTLKQLLELEALDWPVLEHSGPASTVAATIASSNL